MRLLCLLLVCTATGCAPRPAGDVQPAMPNAILLPGVQLSPPADARWARIRSQDEVAFTRTTEEVRARLSAQVLSVEAPANEQAFLRAAEAHQEAAVGALDMVSVHYNRTLLGDALCLQYDGIYRDSLATDRTAQHLTLKGYRCRHPAAERQLLHMEVAIHSATRTAPDAEPLLREADAFFRSVVFTSIPASP